MYPNINNFTFNLP